LRITSIMSDGRDGAAATGVFDILPLSSSSPSFRADSRNDGRGCAYCV
jgi:hypothetical protein